MNESKNLKYHLKYIQNNEFAYKVLQPWYRLCEPPSYW